MAVTFKNDFIDSWVDQGEAQARADDILRILKSRGLRPSQAQRRLIAFCEDLGKLDVWFDRSLIVTSVDELFAEGEDD